MMTVELTAEEIERYRPYHTMEKFWWGFRDYNGCAPMMHFEDVDGQAYDRGGECAMRRATQRLFAAREAGLKRGGSEMVAGAVFLGAALEAEAAGFTDKASRSVFIRAFLEALKNKRIVDKDNVIL